MSPHPDAMLRDANLLPICPPPLDINHSLWVVSKTTLTQHTYNKHIRFGYYDDISTIYSRQLIIDSEATARFDLLQPESFESYINCTPVDQDPNTILETVTLPFP